MSVLMLIFYPQAGGFAGTVVDVALFPLDTIKTRLQSSEGFLRSGGFRGIYRGVLSAAVGSFPGGLTMKYFIPFYR